MEFDYKSVLIYGYGKSGVACEKVLKDLNVFYKIIDDKLKIDGGKYISKINKHNIKMFDLIIVSPAISVYNKIFKMAESNCIKIIGELEFAYLYCCSVPIIAITGTNGKTTTTKFVCDLLNTKFKTDTFGNIGKPLSEAYFIKDLDFAVVEVSSFQLETINKFKPFIGVVLNIDADHIDRHKSVKNYIQLKISMFKNCGEDVTAILNGEDLNICKNKNRIMADKNYFITDYNFAKQLHKIKKVNIFTINKNKIINLSNKTFSVELKDNINKIFYDDIIAAVMVAYILQVDIKDIQKTLNAFKPLSNRVEFVGEINGIKFYNDSKATNIHAVEHSIKVFNNNINLIMGGANKNLKFDDFVRNLKSNVKNIILFGESKNIIFKCFKKLKFFNVFVCEDLNFAVKKAYELAQKNDVVLLSPACASFDEYKSFEERGEHFKEIFKLLKLEEGAKNGK